MSLAHGSHLRGSCEAGTMPNGVAPCSQRVEGRGERVEGRGITTGPSLLIPGASLLNKPTSVTRKRLV